MCPCARGVCAPCVGDCGLQENLEFDTYRQDLCLLTCMQVSCSGQRGLSELLSMEQLELNATFLQRRLMQVLPDGQVKRAAQSSLWEQESSLNGLFEAQRSALPPCPLPLLSL